MTNSRDSARGVLRFMEEANLAERLLPLFEELARRIGPDGRISAQDIEAWMTKMNGLLHGMLLNQYRLEGSSYGADEEGFVRWCEPLNSDPRAEPGRQAFSVMRERAAQGIPLVAPK